MKKQKADRQSYSIKTQRDIPIRLTRALLVSALLLLLVISFPAMASAATKTYTISSGNTRVYSNSALTNGYGWIYGTDEVTVNGIYGTYSKVTYPISRGVKTGYIPTSALFTKTSGQEYTSRAKITTYRRPGGATYGSIFVGDKVLVLGKSGQYTQVRYPISGGYKYAFIPTSSCEKYILPLPANSTLKLSNYSTPGTINQGSGFTCTGTITSNYLITKVTVGIWDANNNPVSKTSRYPNSYSYNIRNLDSDVHFSYAKPGTHTYQVWAVDAKGTRQLLKKTFTVKAVPVSSNLSAALYKNSKAYISCRYDGYTPGVTNGRHEGIDMRLGNGCSIYALTDGVIERVAYGYSGSNGLSTIAVYNKQYNKTIVYLHSNPISGLYAGKAIKKGDKLGTEGWRGVSSAGGSHTHVEVRNGRCGYAAKSLNDYVLENPNPAPFWNSIGYTVK